MRLLDRFRNSTSQQTKGSAVMAKERLQILVAHDRAERNRPPYLSKLKEDILIVVRKYVDVDLNDIQVTYEQDEHREILELNIVLPEAASQRHNLK
ncbi:cell division topological specificity factor [Achromatium sp. WMS1]|nr:cell division topological specificity factor [Achromatium sp. WMS1]